MKKKCSRKVIFCGLALLYLMINGCASVKSAPISEEIKSLSIANESIGYVTLKVANNKNKNYQPNIKYAFIWENKKQDRKKYSFKVLDPYNKVKGEYNEYIITFQLKPGDYMFRELFGQSGIFPVIGSFAVPLYKKLTIPANKFLYFGHIDATVVDRTGDDQLRAGPIIPLIDQAVVGASNGTFVIDISDRYDQDIKLIKEKYSCVGSAVFENMTLNEWIKPTKAAMKY